MTGAVLCLIVLVLLPIVALVVGAFHDKGVPSLAHFQQALSRPAYLRAIYNSLQLGAWTSLFSVLIGVPLAWAVTRTNMPGKNFVRATAILSYLTPPYLIAIAFTSLVAPNSGLYNLFVGDVLGLPWLKFNVFSMAGMVLVTVPHTFPFVFLLAASALQSVDASFEESAQTLGAGRIRTALSITGPLVAPAVLGGTLIAFMNAMALFGSQAIIGIPARIFTVPTIIYTLFDYPPRYGLASALSLVVIAITIIALYLQRGYLARRDYITQSGKGSRVGIVDLGRGRWLPFGFGVFVFVISIAAPYLMLVLVSFVGTSVGWASLSWDGLTLANYRFVLFEYDVTRRAIVNSLFLAATAATAIVVLGALVAWIDQRTEMPGRSLLDYISLVPLGLPGIVMAVALIQFWLAMPMPLYGTLGILLLAYIARFIPFGVRTAAASLRQMDASLEESARILGAGWGRTLWHITLPILRPGLMAGWLLVFVPGFQELSASVLLFTSSTITIAIAILNLNETGSKGPVAALSIINMIIISVAIVLAYRLGGLKSKEAAVTT